MDPAYKRYFKTAGLIWIAFFVLLGIVYIFVLPPQEKTLEKSIEQLESIKKEQDETRGITSDVERKRLLSRIEQLRDDLGFYAVKVEDITDIEFAIKKAVLAMKGITFKSFGRTTDSYVEIANCYHVGTVSFRIDFNASFNSFARVVNTLERFKPVVFVDEFNIQRSSSDNSDHNVSMKLTIFVQLPFEDV